ncbi:MAG: polysaccharide deacetylase family protein [Dichotomicrobium sp.]
MRVEPVKRDDTAALKATEPLRSDWKRSSAQTHPSALHRAGVARKPCYFTVDFEDFLHDFQRARGVRAPRRGPEALSAAYDLIEDFARVRLSGERLTFFVTGQVARDYPDIVRRIAADGHEIGCHYYEHDPIHDHDPPTFRRNLERAVDVIAAASGQPVRGFRAPDFSIDASCAGWAYEVLSEVFEYDSSHVSAHHDGAAHRPDLRRFAGSELHEFAIYQRRLAPGLRVRVVGGTYLRFLPARLILSLLDEAWAKGFVPQVYLHPYDLLGNYEQWSSYADLADLPQPARLYWWARQHQWHSIGNRGVLRKLGRIYDRFEHPGPLGAALDCDGHSAARSGARWQL